MKLTQHILSQISYWTYTTREPFFSKPTLCVFTLHFKQWWKPRVKIEIPWVCVHISESGYRFTYQRNPASYNLETQLKTLE